MSIPNSSEEWSAGRIPATLPPETNMLARVAIVPIYYPLQLLRHLEALEAAEDAFADPRVTALFGVLGIWLIRRRTRRRQGVEDR